MSENKVNNLPSIDRKLSVVISILLKIANQGEEMTLKEQIKELSAFGLNSSEIADILDKKVGYISKELSGLKRETK